MENSLLEIWTEKQEKDKKNRVEDKKSLDLRVKKRIKHGKKGYCLIKKAES